jgi:hypothetical protein
MMAAWLVVMLQKLHTPLYFASVRLAACNVRNRGKTEDICSLMSLSHFDPFRTISKWSILQPSMSGFDG